MAKFVLTFHGGNGMPETEEEGAKVMAAWGAWYGELGGSLVDGGNPFAQSRFLGGGEERSPLTGYTIIEANDIDDAVTKAQRCPVLQSDGKVEVSEAVDIPDM